MRNQTFYVGGLPTGFRGRLAHYKLSIEELGDKINVCIKRIQSFKKLRKTSQAVLRHILVV
jgi:hypothetical protein